MELEYKVKKEDLEKCFKFAVQYHLDERKTSASRTTGQYRGLGSIIDSFFIGKIIEIGVASILEKESNKKCILDFDIHSVTKENISDPDIVKIKEGTEERKPKLFIEIKNISPNDRWVGLTKEQFNTILKTEIAGRDYNKIFIIFATLYSKSQDKDDDLLGVYLKSELNNELFKKFCDIKDLFVKIECIITAKDLKEKGTTFNEGSYMYETEIFQEVNPKTAKKIKEKTKVYKQIKLKRNLLPIIMRDNTPKPKEFGNFKYNGQVKAFIKKNKSSKRMYLFCETDVAITNKVLGIFSLEKEKYYECFFTGVGRNPTLKRNNLWISQRNLPSVMSKSKEELVKDIVEKI